ncbi:hypothetical protein RRG08_011932 [Elysia crispata]|uniref:Uncharacterized protein n=1 Tax=Elysia crispata TaxID=231223 RepID=A0AAE0XW45_9GAST|nr:hypothetical protein RRG08_011932 [Elysia crispata]
MISLAQRLETVCNGVNCVDNCRAGEDLVTTITAALTSRTLLLPDTAQGGVTLTGRPEPLGSFSAGHWSGVCMDLMVIGEFPRELRRLWTY